MSKSKGKTKPKNTNPDFAEYGIQGQGPATPAESAVVNQAQQNFGREAGAPKFGNREAPNAGTTAKRMTQQPTPLDGSPGKPATGGFPALPPKATPSGPSHAWHPPFDMRGSWRKLEARINEKLGGAKGRGK